MKSSTMRPSSGTVGETPQTAETNGRPVSVAPLFSQVVIDQFFAGALEAVGAFFEGHESGIADEDGGVGSIEHGVEIGGHRNERHVWVSPSMEEDAGVGDGGAAGGIGCDAAQFRERL